VQVTIPNGTALGGEVQTGAKRIVGVIMPAAWTAADITIQALAAEPSALPKVQTWAEVVDSAGNNVTITGPAAGEYVALADTLPLVALGRIRLRSGTLALAVNQAAERVLFLIIVDD
jgi:hypothetical protein